MSLLSEKVVVVTGAGSGIGLRTAQLLGRLGARLVLNDAGLGKSGEAEDDSRADDLVKRLQESGVEAVANQDRVENSAGASRLAQLAMDTFGRIDALICNAGFSRDKPLLKMSEADFDDVVGVHLKGTFLCLQAVARFMQKQGEGAIVTTTSASGLLGNYGQVNASAATAGVYGLARTASVELQRYGIRVNAVAPLAKTRLTEDLPMFEQVETMQPEHVAPVHAFLVSDLSRKTTGTVISVAGGRLTTYRMTESAGQFKEDEQGIWTPEEIAQHFASIRKL